MLTLYYKPSCPYCQRVLRANEMIGAPLMLTDVAADVAAKRTLLEQGGKVQVPFLMDTNRGVSLYESLDIVEYLRQWYGDGVMVDVPAVGNVCPVE